MGRPEITTVITGRGSFQSDLGYILDNSGNIINDNSGFRILVHTGVFYDSGTTITGRTTVTTDITGRLQVATSIT